MRGVGFRGEGRMREPALPRLAAKSRVAAIRVEVDVPLRCRVAGPQPVRPPEVRDPGVGRDARAGQDDDASRGVAIQILLFPPFWL